MSLYYYTARGKSGNVIRGTYEATDKSTIVAMLKTKGYIPLKVEEKIKGGISSINVFKKGIPIKDIAIFCKQFSAILEAGITVLESIDITRKQTDNKILKDVLNKVFEQVQKGRSLSDSFREFRDILPTLLINMIEAGEASGTLDKVMARLAVNFENDSKLISKVKGAMIYPVAICIISIIAVLVLMVYVVPQFQNMFGSMGAELPAMTKMLISASQFIGKYIILIILLLVGSVVSFLYYIRGEKGKFFYDRLMLKIPYISGLYKKLNAARFSRTLSSLLSAGIPLIQALEITDKVIDNAVMSKYLAKVRDDVTKGTRLSATLSTVPIMPTMIVSMVNIGEESGSIDSVLDKTADFFEEETRTAISGLVSMIEPAVIVVMAVVVGTIIISIVQPMFGMFENVQNM